MSVFHDPSKDALQLFLLQLMIIIVLTRLISRILRRLQQPAVIGEIIAGILLGPSAFGYIPGFSAFVFPQRSLPILNVMANVGLILFMFFLGMEVEPAQMLATWKTSVPIALAGLLVPWISGGLLSLYLYNIEVTEANKTVYFLFTGTAFSFTAMPVLGRILTARKLVHTRLGVEALSIAAVDDLLAWTTLAIVLAYSSGSTPVNGVYTILISIVFVLVLIFGVRRLNHWLLSRLKKKGKEESRNFTAFILLSLCLAALFADIIGIHAFFGAFLYGMMVPRGHFLDYLAPKIELLVVEFFLPLYFAKSGIATKFGSLDTGQLWGITILVLIIAAVAKIFPAAVGTYLASGFKADWRHCMSVGMLINTRGLVALIVLNIGYKAKIFGVKVFTIMVFMALVTTFMTSPSIAFLQHKRSTDNSAKGHPKPADVTANSETQEYVNSGATLNAASAELLARQLREAQEQNKLSANKPGSSENNSVMNDPDDEDERRLATKPHAVPTDIYDDDEGRSLAIPKPTVQ